MFIGVIAMLLQTVQIPDGVNEEDPKWKKTKDQNDKLIEKAVKP